MDRFGRKRPNTSMQPSSSILNSDSGRRARAGTFRSSLALAGLSLCILAGWMLRHPYLGISFNDSTLYSLQALVRLHPQSLSTDIFLRFGSQDHYTVFSPLFAFCIRALDLEPAAALLTAIAQLAFFGCAWLFARQVMPARRALLALALLIVLPSSYGVGNFFSYVESFLTPRQIAEALVLACLASALACRGIIAGACLLAAMSLHPIMGFAGIVMLFCMYVAIPHPRGAHVTAVPLAVGTAVLALTEHSGPFAPFDPAWLKLIRDYTPYLFITEWPAESWDRIIVAVAGLAVGALTSAAPAVVRLCRAALLTALCSMLVTLIYCDLLHVVIFTQMQAWRWLWLVEASAVVLLPAIVPDCWRSGAPGRTTVILLVSAWILRDYAVCAYVGLSAVASAALSRRLIQPNAARLLLMGSYAILLIALTINLSAKLSDLFLGASSQDSTALLLVLQWGEDGVFCAAILVMSWWLVERSESVASALLVATAGAVACLTLAKPVKHSWTDFHYTHALQSKFAAWRAAIPPEAEVIWPGTPLGAWYLLERASYYSIHQAAGDIFSREKAMEIHSRAQLVGSALAAGAPAQPTDRSPGRQKLVLPINADKLNAQGLPVVCSDPALGFVVSWSRLGGTPFASIVPNPNKPASPLYLYRCADFRTAKPPAPDTTVR
jgi:hypothetical protein